MVRPRVFLDFSVNDEHFGRVILELFNDSVPKTCENFRALCTGEKGLSSSGIPLYYKNSIIHRSIKDFMIQGGDFTKRNGSGGESIYGGFFPDENLTRTVDSEALLCMANKGPNTNGSQFFITLRDCPHLNGKHVVFGKVIRGYDEVVKRVAAVPVDEKDRPLTSIYISSCGELELRKKRDTTSKPSKRSSSNPESEDETKTDKHTRRSPTSSPEQRQRKRTKRRKRTDEAEGEEKVKSQNPVKETEEEYDARLEIEEKIRLEAQRRIELEHIKHRYDSDPRNKEGIRFKGRGRMKYIDPEINHKR